MKDDDDTASVASLGNMFQAHEEEYGHEHEHSDSDETGSIASTSFFNKRIHMDEDDDDEGSQHSQDDLPKPFSLDGEAFIANTATEKKLVVKYTRLEAETSQLQELQTKLHDREVSQLTKKLDKIMDEVGTLKEELGRVRELYVAADAEKKALGGGQGTAEARPANGGAAIARPQNSALMEGFMKKKSRHFKVWRRRWCVLSSGVLKTYKSPDFHGQSPTETITLGNTKADKGNADLPAITVSALGSNRFELLAGLGSDRVRIFSFEAENEKDKAVWVSSINRAVG